MAGPSVLLTTADAVRLFFPRKERRGLGADAIDPVTTAAGVLAGQTVALTLSVGFHAANPSFGGSCIGFDARQVVNPESTSASQINDCLAHINQNFVDGKTDNGGLAIGAPLAGDFRTHEQVEWGQTALEGSAGAYRDATIALAFPTGVHIGADALGVPGFSALFTTSAAVEAFLPQVGVAGPLTADAVDPIATDGGALAGDTLALALNLGFDGFEPAFGASCAPLAGAVATVTPDRIDACVVAVNANSGSSKEAS